MYGFSFCVLFPFFFSFAFLFVIFYFCEFSFSLKSVKSLVFVFAPLCSFFFVCLCISFRCNLVLFSPFFSAKLRMSKKFKKVF